MIYGTFGIHPHETEESLLIDKNYIINQINQNERIIGIGETGLDFFYNHSNKERQIDSFKAHIEASIDLICLLSYILEMLRMKHMKF